MEVTPDENVVTLFFYVFHAISGSFSENAGTLVFSLINLIIFYLGAY